MSKQLKGDYAPADIAVFLVMGQLSLNHLLSSWCAYSGKMWRYAIYRELQGRDDWWKSYLQNSQKWETKIWSLVYEQNAWRQNNCTTHQNVISVSFTKTIDWSWLGKDSCLLWDLYETLKFTPWGKWRL